MVLTLDAPCISNRSEGANTIDWFPPQHCFEHDHGEIANADSERCLGRSRSLRIPRAYGTLAYFVSSANLSRTRPPGESQLSCVLRMPAATDKWISTLGRVVPPNAEHWGAPPHVKRFLPLSGNGERRFRMPRVLVKISEQASAPRRDPFYGSSRRSCRTRTNRGSSASG